MFDILAITTNIGVISYFIFSLFTGGLESFNNNYLFIGYIIFATLTLPNLISKVIFRSKIVGLTTALCFLYFPLQFFILVLISNLSGLSLSEILPFGSIFNIILWNILFVLFILLDEKRGDYSEKIVKNIIYALIPGIFFSLFVAIFIRQIDSVVALDYLQHLTVSNKIFFNEILCVLPSQCSNLFLQEGYTTFYHIILGNLTVFLQNDPIKTFYILDLVFPLVASIPLFYIFKRYTANTMWSQLGVLLSLSVFVMGGYDFIFFIPQTFALLLFLMIFKDRRLNLFKLLLASVLLISTHFIIGAFFAGLLLFKYFIIDNLKNRKEVKIYYLILLLSLFFFVLANIAGFSVEKLIQGDAVKVIGSLTNPYFPNNIPVYLQILGPIWIFILIAYLSNLLGKDTHKSSMISMSFIVIGTICYFLAPTYANKFTIGIGVFSSILLISFLSKLNLKFFSKLLVSISLVGIFLINFYIQYNRYLTFYTQSNGTVSAITKEDKAIVEYLNENSTDSLIISDPYTQLIVASLTNTDTLQAQYMQLDTRNNLLEYLKNPNPKTYESLITSSGFPSTEDFKILYTSRLYRSINSQDTAWIYNIYSLSINNTEIIEKLDEKLIEDIKRIGKEPVYISDNFILFK
ncbi:MAG: hypothetical protein AB9915_03670 [Candidatus Dojkabacteria bacterium]